MDRTNRPDMTRFQGTSRSKDRSDDYKVWLAVHEHVFPGLDFLAPSSLASPSPKRLQAILGADLFRVEQGHSPPKHTEPSSTQRANDEPPVGGNMGQLGEAAGDSRPSDDTRLPLTELDGVKQLTDSFDLLFGLAQKEDTNNASNASNAHSPLKKNLAKNSKEKVAKNSKEKVAKNSKEKVADLKRNAHYLATTRCKELTAALNAAISGARVDDGTQILESFLEPLFDKIDKSYKQKQKNALAKEIPTVFLDMVQRDKRPCVLHALAVAQADLNRSGGAPADVVLGETDFDGNSHASTKGGPVFKRFSFVFNEAITSFFKDEFNTAAARLRMLEDGCAPDADPDSPPKTVEATIKHWLTHPVAMFTPPSTLSSTLSPTDKGQPVYLDNEHAEVGGRVYPFLTPTSVEKYPEFEQDEGRSPLDGIPSSAATPPSWWGKKWEASGGAGEEL